MYGDMVVIQFLYTSNRTTIASIEYAIVAIFYTGTNVDASDEVPELTGCKHKKLNFDLWIDQIRACCRPGRF